MSRLPPDWTYGEDLALLSEPDRAQILEWLRGCGVDPDRTRAIRIEASDPSRVPVVVTQEYAQWPITVGPRGIEMRTETYITVGAVPSLLTSGQGRQP